MRYATDENLAWKVTFAAIAIMGAVSLTAMAYLAGLLTI